MPVTTNNNQPKLPLVTTRNNNQPQPLATTNNNQPQLPQVITNNDQHQLPQVTTNSRHRHMQALVILRKGNDIPTLTTRPPTTPPRCPRRKSAYGRSFLP